MKSKRKAQAAQKDQALSEKELLNSEAAGEKTSKINISYRVSSQSVSCPAQTETLQEREEKLQVTFTVIGTATQLVDLESYMKNAQLRYTFQ